MKCKCGMAKCPECLTAYAVKAASFYKGNPEAKAYWEDIARGSIPMAEETDSKPVQ